MTKRANYTLWAIQGLLALLFLFAGGMKLLLPVAELTKQMPLPGWFVRSLGVAELAGALGLVLPGMLRARQELTPLAAGGLVIIMTGATVLTLTSQDARMAFVPALVGVLCGLVAWRRARVYRRETCLAVSQS